MLRPISWPVAAASCFILQQQNSVYFDNKQALSFFIDFHNFFYHNLGRAWELKCAVLILQVSFGFVYRCFFGPPTNATMTLCLHSNGANSWNGHDLKTGTRPLFSSESERLVYLHCVSYPRQPKGKTAFDLDRKITSRACSCVSKSSFERSASDKY